MNFFHKIVFLSKGAALCSAVLFSLSCSSRISDIQKNDNNLKIESWVTKGDQTAKLQKQPTISFGNAANSYQNIIVDDSQKFQTVDGFGFTLTGGSVDVINRLSPSTRKALLEEMFGNSENSISVSYLRISIGASDLNSEVFSYDDVPAGQTDPTLSKFSLIKDQPVISMLKEILAINPKIKIMAVPWSAPVWMKDNGSSVGGSLKPEFYGVYARYFVKYIQEMAQNGITIDAICPQNEPLNPKNNPSLYMDSDMQKDFIKNHLGPEFQKAGISTKIVVYDHNCNRPDYPMNILADPEAAKYVDGSAFHLYEGEISALSTVHNAYPNKNLYFTEQWTGSKGEFNGDFNWAVKNVIIGSMRNWSKTALEWNLANDANFEPHTPGGCTECKGGITVNSSNSFERNVMYYIVAQASKFVPAGSVRIASTQSGKLSTAAFITPAGKRVLIVQNDGDSIEDFNIKLGNKSAAASLNGKSAATYVF